MMKRGLGLLAVIGLVVGLGAIVLGKTSVPDLPLKRFTRLVVSHELNVRHWKALEAGTFKEYVDELHQKLLDAGDIGASWTAKFIPDDKRGETPLTEAEQAMLKTLDAGAEEVWESPAPGTVRYMRVFPVDTGSCRLCHTTRHGDSAVSTMTTPESSNKPTSKYIASFEITLKDH